MISGNLFTRDYLLEGIARTEQWKALTDREFQALKKHLSALAESFSKHKSPNEAVTEKDFIYPVLDGLGWKDVVVQPNLSAKGRKQVPDALLLADAGAKNKAVSEGKDWKGFKHGLAILEAKRWLRSLDTGTRGEEGAPDAQMLQYLSRADIQTRISMSLFDKLAAVAKNMNVAFASAVALGFVGQTPPVQFAMHVLFWPAAALAAFGAVLLLAEAAAALLAALAR